MKFGHNDSFLSSNQQKKLEDLYKKDKYPHNRIVQVVNVMKNLQNEKNLKTNFGIAYNPYLEKYYGFCGEKVSLEKKISSGLTKSIWLQFGTDIKLLESEINFLKSCVKNLYKTNHQDVKFYGSLLIPSRQFIARFKFRPWKGVYISNKYLNSLANFNSFTKDLIQIYLENNICPVIETEFSTLDKLETVHNLLNK